jgi:hypothetical protein
MLMSCDNINVWNSLQILASFAWSRPTIKIKHSAGIYSVAFNHLAGNILLLIYRLIKDYLAEFKCVLKMKSSIIMAGTYSRNCITVNASFIPVVIFSHFAGNIRLLIYHLIKDYLAEFKCVLKMKSSVHLTDRSTRICITINASLRLVSGIYIHLLLITLQAISFCWFIVSLKISLQNLNASWKRKPAKIWQTEIPETALQLRAVSDQLSFLAA